MSRSRLILSVLALFILAACTKPVIYEPDEVVARAAYTANEPPSITLVTVISNTNGSGGHSALVINASQRAIFDPAGNYKAAAVPEQNDFLYGITPAALRSYYGFHARKEWHVVTQKIEVTPEVAEAVFQAAKNYGPVPDGFCSASTTKILRSVPGFESIPQTFFPVRTMKAFAKLPGVETNKIFEDD